MLSVHKDSCLRTFHSAGVAKLVYALDLGSSAARRESSSLSFRTKYRVGSSEGYSQIIRAKKNRPNP